MFKMMCKLIGCDEHRSNVMTFYCNDHEEYGCEECLNEKHKPCVDVVKANSLDIQENYETEKELIEGTAKYVVKHAETYFDRKTTYVEETNLHVEEITDALKSIRKKTNHIFDIFEANTTKRAQAIATKLVSSADNDRRLLKDMITASQLSILLLGKLNSFEHGNQHDLIVRKLKESMKAYEEQLIGISETKEGAIELKHSEVLTNFINVGDNNTKELGTVTIVDKARKSKVYKSQLLLRQWTVKKQKDVSLSPAGRLKMHSCMSFLSSGDLILTDETHGYSVRINQNGQASQALNLSLPSSKTDRTEINNLLRAASKREGVVAVPRHSQKKILLISVNEELKKMTEIKTLYHPKAIHILRNGNIAVAWNNPVAFGIISVADTSSDIMSYLNQDSCGRKLQSFDFMAVDEKRSHVIQPCGVDHSIYSFDFKGNPRFQYTHSGGANCLPRDVALDGDGNIYACVSKQYISSLIIVLTPGGKCLQTIGTNVGCPYQPFLIEFDRAGTTFAVSDDRSNGLTLFKLQNAPDS